MAGIVHYGWAESTAAMRNILGGNQRIGTTRKKRRAKKASKAPRARKRTKRASKGKKAHLVKGSAAAKRFMAKLRAKVGKKRG